MNTLHTASYALKKKLKKSEVLFLGPQEGKKMGNCASFSGRAVAK